MVSICTSGVRRCSGLQNGWEGGDDQGYRHKLRKKYQQCAQAHVENSRKRLAPRGDVWGSREDLCHRVLTITTRVAYQVRHFRYWGFLRASALVYVLIGLCVQSEWENATSRRCNVSKAIT